MLSPSASSPKLSVISKYFFRVYASAAADAAEGSFMAATAFQKLQLRSVAIMYINNEFGLGLQRVFRDRFETLGGKVHLTLAYDRDQTDSRTQLTRIKATRPDGLFLAGYYQDGGWRVKRFCAPDGP